MPMTVGDPDQYCLETLYFFMIFHTGGGGSPSLDLGMFIKFLYQAPGAYLKCGNYSFAWTPCIL